MSVRKWALKIGELKPLSRSGLLLLSVRSAMRVEPWLPPGADSLWRKGIEELTSAAFKKPGRPRGAMTLARELSDLGVTACNHLSTTDEPLGRCMNYATLTLTTAIEATNLDLGPELNMAVIASAKFSSSIAGVLAHANRVVVPPGNDPVESRASRSGTRFGLTSRWSPRPFRNSKQPKIASIRFVDVRHSGLKGNQSGFRVADRHRFTPCIP